MAALAAVALTGPATAVAPTNPSDAQIATARRTAQQRAAEVGQLTAALAVKQGEMQRVAQAAEIAVEHYNKARIDLRKAADTLRRTRTAAVAAQSRVDQARQNLVRFARGSYIQGSLLSSSVALIAPGGPGEVISRMEYLDVTSRRRLDVVGAMVRARVAKANADSAARVAVAQQQAAATAASRAKAAAEYRVVRSRSQIARLEKQTGATRQRVSEATATLRRLQSQRGDYLAWERRQRQLAHLQQLAHQQQIAHQLAAATRPAAEEVPPPQSFGGAWSPDKGKAVAAAALRWLGTPYAWAGGDASGPTYGEYPDASVRGFDCSGLALWAWAQVGVALPHFSGYQYESGRHVARGDLMPGDLLFWSTDGTPDGVHHVAVYLGGGRVVQAPQSGDVVRISPVWYDGYLGATRPGT